MNPVCGSCKKEYVAVKTGVVVKINEYYVYRGDKFRCPSCGHEMVCNFGQGYRSPIEASQTDFQLIQ